MFPHTVRVSSQLRLLMFLVETGGCRFHLPEQTAGLQSDMVAAV